MGRCFQSLQVFGAVNEALHAICREAIVGQLSLHGMAAHVPAIGAAIRERHWAEVACVRLFSRVNSPVSHEIRLVPRLVRAVAAHQQLNLAPVLDALDFASATPEARTGPPPRMACTTPRCCRACKVITLLMHQPKVLQSHQNFPSARASCFAL